MPAANELPPEFWDTADAFINLANSRSEELPIGKVSVAFLYATARFNTFVMATSCKDREEFASKAEEGIAYYLEQFEMMLKDHFEDYKKHFNN